MSSGGMGDLSDEAARETDAALKSEEAQLLLQTQINWERLRPQIADQATYDAVIAVVKEATRQNESVGQLKVRLQTLGKAGAAVVRKVLTIAGRGLSS